jgi:hypothetical protein
MDDPLAHPNNSISVVEKQISNGSAGIVQQDATTSQIDIKTEVKPGETSNSPPSNNNGNMEPPDWHEVFKDATELESLIFCIRRPTARDRLFTLVNNMKTLSGKLKRYEEVKLHKTITFDSLLKKRGLENKAEEGATVKKPRAIPLDPVHIGDKEKDSKNAHEEKLPMPKSLSLTEPPMLKVKDKWVQNHKRSSSLYCPDFESSNSCPLGTSCNLLHIFTPRKANPTIEKDGRLITLRYTKEDLEIAYETYRNMSISKSDYFEKIKNDEANMPNYCCAINCPVDHIIYYAQPFPGDVIAKANKSAQGIWWYKSMKDAKDAVATHLICDLKERHIIPKDFMPRDQSDIGLGKKFAVQKATQLAKKSIIFTSGSSMKERNTAAPILPDIMPLNFMESNYEKRCTQFNTPAGCQFACRCQYAHVYYPSELDSSNFPSKEALTLAYRLNFQMELEDSFFQGSSRRLTNSPSPIRVMTAIDNQGGLWYTAALKCPREGTIYYAAGGNTGQINKQNVVMYPGVEDAKLAVAGIVLNAFRKRGMFGERNSGGIQTYSQLQNPFLHNGQASVLQKSSGPVPSHQPPCHLQPHTMHHMQPAHQQMQAQVHAHQYSTHFHPVGMGHHDNLFPQGSYGIVGQPYQSQPQFVAAPAAPPPPSRIVTDPSIYANLSTQPPPPPPLPRSQSFGK